MRSSIWSTPRAEGSTGAVEGASGGAQKLANRSAQDRFFKARYRQYIYCVTVSVRKRETVHICASHTCVADLDGHHLEKMIISDAQGVPWKRSSGGWRLFTVYCSNIKILINI